MTAPKLTSFAAPPRRGGLPAWERPCSGFEAGALLSTAATWCQALLVLGAVSRPLCLALLPAAVAGAGVAAGSGRWRARAATAHLD